MLILANDFISRHKPSLTALKKYGILEKLRNGNEIIPYFHLSAGMRIEL